MLNPFNVKVTDANKTMFVQIDEARSKKGDSFADYYAKKINGKVNKKFYLSLDMNEFGDSSEDIFAWPQINNITFHMPSSPLFYQNSKMNKVILYKAYCI
jgi:hypothetical protein